MANPDSLMSLVDGWRDPEARCPGSVGGLKLIPIAIQTHRRLRNLFKKTPKHIIYQLGNTRGIWYKNSKCHVMAVKMGLSIRRLAMHPKAVPMEQYAKYFIDKIDVDWLKRNNYQFI